VYRILFIFALIFTLGFSGCRSVHMTNSATAPLFNNLGNYHHPISTKSQLAQRYFDQGLILAYGFNHAEAERSFREAAKLDPDCAICNWGVALVLGSNINAAMDDTAVSPAWEALQKALQLSGKASEKEKAYIQALAKRYSQKPVEDRKSLNIDYANAMREVAKIYPDDLDAATLFAEALMNTMPWDYWQENGKPKLETQEILATLETVLKRNPNHPGANHLYIHAVEAVRPELGVAAADRLGNLVPGSGHLVHMPSHIYIRVGRYHDAAIANQQAIAADKEYITQCHKQGMYPLAYVPHNHHFLWAAATMEGNQKLAMQAAYDTAAMADEKQMREPGYGTLQHYYSIPLYTLTRFGKWDEILAEPAPADDLKYPTGVWHYARGTALTAKGQLQEAARELEHLQAIAADPALEKVTIWDINTTGSLLKIASEVLTGKLAAKQGDYEKAIAHLKTAVNLEDKLNYDEPPPWHYPVRQSLGAVLLEANRPAEAEIVYHEDLKRFPENGWSLAGLAKSLEAQGKTEEAQAVQKRFTTAWKHADLSLTVAQL
jgi:tetratricopeptide (TPR) repeat protein